MRWGISGAACIAALMLAVGHASAEDLQGQLQTRSSFSIESSLRTRFTWTEMAYRGNREKAWAEMISPEARVSLRLLTGILEGKIELGAVADDFVRFDLPATDQLKAEVQLGLRLGNWSVLAEWKGRDTFNHDSGDFVVGLNVYDLRVRNRFRTQLFENLAAAQSQISIAGGYSASMPSLFQRNFAEAELEVIQPLPDGFSIVVAPKIELNDYVDFAGTDRKDAVMSLRVVPGFSFDDGATISIEGQVSVAVSTLETKTGEAWAVTPIIRLQKSL